ncbi:MAG: glycoside hydrolase family protein, partial [Bradyrhizobium sp.]|nr:glycoside hydrolase family protein [Bradyrhizobium sp.]
YWTVAYGCRWLANGQPVTESTSLTQDQAEVLLDTMLAALAKKVDPWLPPWTTGGQAAALLDFAWNEGDTALRDSTLLALFDAGDVAGAAAEFPKWIYGGGRKLDDLVGRRAAERELFLSDTQAGSDVVSSS